MANTLYKVINNFTIMHRRASILSGFITLLAADTYVEVVSISGGWANAIYNNKNGYILSYKLKLVTGSVTIKYVDENNVSISNSKIYTNLAMGNYTYTAITIPGYTLTSPSTLSITLSKTNLDPIITFKYKKTIATKGSVTIVYIDENSSAKISDNDVYSNLDLGSYTYTAKKIEGYTLAGNSTQTVTLTTYDKDKIIIFNYKKNSTNIYVIDLVKFGIKNDNTDGIATTKGINDGLRYAKSNGFSKIKLPPGTYAIDMTEIQAKNVMPYEPQYGGGMWTHNCTGIVLPSNIEFDISNCILKLVPNDKTDYSIVTFSQSDNSKLIGGLVQGDKYTHNYGLKINWDETSLESGDFNATTGEPIDDATKVRLKDYITEFTPGESLPSSFYICPFDDTTVNSVDGGVKYVYCYDINNKFLGVLGGGFISVVTLLSGTAKIKISFKNEKRLDAKYYLTKKMSHYTYEFGFGITFTDTHNNVINTTEVKECTGDCICTTPPPCTVTVDNLTIIGCTLEDSRRQGISFTSVGTGCIVKDTKIGKISGIDPQCGIDFETEGGKITNTIIDNCEFYDNKKWDIINYNSLQIEIKNSEFTGAVATTYGTTMNIHDNKFKFKNREKNDKIFEFSGVQSINDGIYIYNNTFEDGGCDLRGKDNKFYNNTLNNCKNALIILGDYVYDNKYYGGSVRYGGNDTNYTGEKYYNCSIGCENNGTLDADNNKINYRTLTNCEFNDCIVSGANTLKIFTIQNSLIYNNTISFYNSRGYNVTLDQCNITTEYSSNIPFIKMMSGNILYKSCTMNLGISQFLGLNYGNFTMDNCTVIFNNGFGDGNNAIFYTNVTGTGNFNNNNYYKSFSTPTINLPPQIGATINGNASSDNLETLI